MIQSFALIPRRPDHSREAFRDHYETTHAPLAMPLMQGLARYVRYHITEEIHGEPAFDVVSGFAYRSGADAAATVARIGSEEGDAIRADEQRFMVRDAVEILMVSPDPSVEGDLGSDPLIVLVRAPEAGREAWLTDYDAKRAPALLESLDGVRCAIEHTTTPTTPAPASWDRITQVSSEGPGGLADWIRDVESAGGSVCAVRTQAHESPIAE